MRRRAQARTERDSLSRQPRNDYAHDPRAFVFNDQQTAYTFRDCFFAFTLRRRRLAFAFVLSGRPVTVSKKVLASSRALGLNGSASRMSRIRGSFSSSQQRGSLGESGAAG